MLSSVTDTDRGLKALFGRLKGSKGVALTIGVHGPEGDAPHEGFITRVRMTLRHPGRSALTVAQLATIHEFGLGNNPSRSFIRAWADEKRAEHLAAMKTIGQAVVQGTYTAIIGLERLGSLFVGEVQARISAGIAPPLKTRTAERKGSTVPLVNTGQLKSAIRFMVRKIQDS